MAEQENGQNGAGDASFNKVSADNRKVFVGGLTSEATEKQLTELFGQYGEIESINIKTDPNTGRSKGFAFVVFTNADAVDKVIAAGELVINNKKVGVKKAKAQTGKIFVGGLTPELTDDDIRNHFKQYGNIVEVELPFDKTKNQRKKFCFITFDSIQVVKDLLQSPKQIIKGQEVDVKKATPKPDQMGGGRGGGGGSRGRGGYGGYQSWDQGYGGGYDGYSQDYGYGGGYGGDYGYGGGYGGGYDSYGNYGDTYGGSGGFQSGKQRGGGRGGGGGGGGGQRNQRFQPY